ncbi:MAG: hypothetical protein ACRD47_13470 [Nitrososphaeraceae archaeon]
MTSITKLVSNVFPLVEALENTSELWFQVFMQLGWILCILFFSQQNGDTNNVDSGTDMTTESISLGTGEENEANSQLLSEDLLLFSI